MAEGGDAGVERETVLVGEEVLDFARSDFRAILVASALGDDDNGLSLS